MNSIVPLRDGGELTQFDPAQMQQRQAKLDALIDYARRVKDWPLLDEAVDAKIEDQISYLVWWDAKVREKGERANVAERGHFVRDVYDDTGITKQQVSRWRKSLEEPDRYRAKLILAAYRKADLAPAEHHLAKATGDNEWFTPAQYVEAARTVMGGIDLDPASHPLAQETVNAARFYTAEDDGLAQPWHGRMWLNPPYAQPLMAQFVQKMVAEYAAQRVTQAVMLTNNSTDTEWFHQAEAHAGLLCFTKGRIRFVDPDGSECEAPLQGQTFFYFGGELTRFREAFGAFGFIR